MGLLAVTAAMYAAYHGPDGLAAIARGTHRSARGVLAATLRHLGRRTDSGALLETIGIDFAGDADEEDAPWNVRVPPGTTSTWCSTAMSQARSCDDNHADDQLREAPAAAICGWLFAEAGKAAGDQLLRRPGRRAARAAAASTLDYLTHLVFSEHGVLDLRYLPISWPGFAAHAVRAVGAGGRLCRADRVP